MSTEDETTPDAETPAPQPRAPRVRVHNDTPVGERAIEAAILSHVLACPEGGSTTPAEVAQAMGADWRTKLTAVRRAAIRLAVAGQIDILRKGKRVDPIDVKGVIRLRVGPMRSDPASPFVAPLPDDAS
jgi:hypothetical protein